MAKNINETIKEQNNKEESRDRTYREDEHAKAYKENMQQAIEENLENLKIERGKVTTPQNEDLEEERVQIYETWAEYNLKEELERGIYACGFDNPSWIQKTAIMPILCGRDVRAQAQSGTGKTAAFGVSALQKLSGKKQTEILILVTSREIADQNTQRLMSLAQYMDVNVVTLVGGLSVEDSIIALRNNPEIVVGTPGRTLHMIEAGYFDTSNIELMIIDEADEMMNKGFQKQLKDIFGYIPESAQICMFSATWESEAISVATDILTNPVNIDLRYDEQTLKGIDQFYVCLGNKPPRNADSIKVKAFADIYQKQQLAQSIIFVSTKAKATYVYNELCKMKIPCDMIHSELSQNDRSKVLEKFRSGSGRLLIATGLI